MTEIDSPTYTAGGTYPEPTPSLIAPRFLELVPDLAPAPIPVYPVALTDVSIWQGDIDWARMATKAQAVFIRAGFGNDGYDGKAEQNAAEAKAAGMEYGLYWFVKAGKDFKKHVASFQNVWQEFGGNLPPVMDCELTEYTSQIKNNTTNWLTKLVKNWEEATGVKPIIYTRASWWDANTYRSDWPKLHDLWTAHYTNAAQPLIPADWGKVSNPRTWTFWQWSADKNGEGAAHGAESYSIDKDRFNGTIEQFNYKYKVAIKPLDDGTLPPPPVVLPDFVRVSVANANIRSEPRVDPLTDVGDLALGAKLPVTGQSGEWWEVGPMYVHKTVAKAV